MTIPKDCFRSKGNLAPCRESCLSRDCQEFGDDDSRAGNDSVAHLKSVHTTYSDFRPILYWSGKEHIENNSLLQTFIFQAVQYLEMSSNGQPKDSDEFDADLAEVQRHHVKTG